MVKTIRLAEGISHLEDLSLTDFIRVVKNISTMSATEKLDGANLWFGLDDQGKLFTTREGKTKSAQRMYSEADYPYYASSNPFRAAHAALEEKLEDIKRVMRAGDTVEIEVLFGRQPNAITYGLEGKNYIAFLRGVNGTPDVIADQLATTIGNSSVTVNVKIVQSPDGEKLDAVPTELTFRFTASQRVPADKIKDVDVQKHLTALEEYLNQKNQIGEEEVSNFELLTRSLGSFHEDVRAEAKELKKEVTAKVLSDFKLPIKRDLLNDFVNKIKPALGAIDITPDEDIGVEGVVLRDPQTGEQIKLVDKDSFTTINQFNHSVRYKINGPVRTLDAEAPIESRGGIVGDMKIHIADLLGNKDFARGAGIKKAFTSLSAQNPTDAINKLANTLDISDFIGVKNKITSLITATIEKLSGLLSDFKEHKDSYHLRLKSGKTMGLTDAVVQRTYLAFAEARRDLLELKDKVKSTRTLEQLLAVLYGRQAKAMFADSAEQVSEDLLTEARYDNDLKRYANKDAWTLLNIYMATILTSVTVYQAHDEKGIRMLKDKSNYQLKSWNNIMSPLNFWGYVIWKSSAPAIKKIIGNKTSAAIFKIARRVPANAFRQLHLDLSFGKDAPIHWADHIKTIRILQQFPGIYTDRINNLIGGAFNYDKLSHDQRVKFVSTLYFYMQQFVPTSPLLNRLSAIQHDLLLSPLALSTAPGVNAEEIQEMKLLQDVQKIVEDGEAEGAANAPASATTVATTTSNIAPVEGGGIAKTHQIVKRKRNPDVKRKKFEKPKEASV